MFRCVDSNVHVYVRVSLYALLYDYSNDKPSPYDNITTVFSSLRPYTWPRIHATTSLQC